MQMQVEELANTADNTRGKAHLQIMGNGREVRTAQRVNIYIL